MPNFAYINNKFVNFKSAKIHIEDRGLQFADSVYEVIAVLDDAGREKLVEVLLKEDLNTYIVSHGWTHPLLDKVEVVKSGNISRLE